MNITEYESKNYRLKTCIESEHFKIERINPRESIGYLQMNVTEGRLEIRDLWIDEEPVNFRGKGFGTILVKHAFEYALSREIEFVFGSTAPDDLRVHHFYQKCGFMIFFDEEHGTAWFICSLKGELTEKPDMEQLARLSGLKCNLDYE